MLDPKAWYSAQPYIVLWTFVSCLALLVFCGPQDTSATPLYLASAECVMLGLPHGVV